MGIGRDSFSTELQDIGDHGSDTIKDQVQLGFTHVCRRGHHLILMVHMGFVRLQGQGSFSGKQHKYDNVVMAYQFQKQKGHIHSIAILLRCVILARAPFYS